MDLLAVPSLKGTGGTAPLAGTAMSVTAAKDDEHAAFFGVDGFNDALDRFEGETILTVQEVEDAVGDLGTFKETQDNTSCIGIDHSR